ncbi:MAG: hypothetical protein KBF91_03230 [Alphaproteobacteria bacterium]|nr:hypothetical protein [Alphaproteobacteria bacterium]
MGIYGDPNNRNNHGFRAGFIPVITPFAVASAFIAAGTIDPDIASIVAAGLGLKAVAKDHSYDAQRYLVGVVFGTTLGFNLTSSTATYFAHQGKPKAPFAEPTHFTLRTEQRGSNLYKDFNVAKTTDAGGREGYILTVSKTATALIPIDKGTPSSLLP